ncbi:MAG TPA: alkaline phosphatase family protein [Mobilitalea sp.]|nr:alkaline phosphatase family protein [Mobilitalea sp.]
MADKTILIILDGCGYDAATENLGYLEHLVAAGKGCKLKVQGELPSVSRPMYETILTGLPVHQHGITNNLIVRTSNQISLFDLCRNNNLTTAASAYYWISELYVRSPFVHTEDRLQLYADAKIQHGIYYYEDQYPDSHVFCDAEYLHRHFQPDFLLVHTMNIDDAGHKYGSDSTEYHKAAAYENLLLSTFLPLWLMEGWQIVVTADHGMNEHRLHGGNSPLQRLVPLYIISDKVVKDDFTCHTFSELIVAPLLCRLLGIEPSAGMKVISEMEEDIFEA